MRYIWLIPLLPGFGAVINGLLGIRLFSRKTAGLVACSTMAAAVLVEFGAILVSGYMKTASATTVAPEVLPVTGNTEQVGWMLYTSYLIPFEIASMLLLVAMIGAIVLAKREL